MSDNFSKSKYNDDHNKLVCFVQDEWLHVLKGVIKNISITRRDKMLSLEFKCHEKTDRDDFLLYIYAKLYKVRYKFVCDINSNKSYLIG